MPVDVVSMPAAFHSDNYFMSQLRPPTCSRLRGSTNNQTTLTPATEGSRFDPLAMAGDMVLISPAGRRQDVQVKVYRTSLEHFAVIYPQKKVCKPLGVINLKNTTVDTRTNESGQFKLRQKGFDNTASLTFIPTRVDELDAWMAAFASRASPTIMQTCLPVVEEDDDEY